MRNELRTKYYQASNLFTRARTLATKLRKTGRYPATEIFLVLQEIYHAGYADGENDES